MKETSMADFVVLTCPNCGGKLQVTNDVDRFACGFCGTEMIVKRGGGIVSLAPVMEGLTRIQGSMDRTASELAIVRLNKEIAHLQADLGEVEARRRESIRNGANTTFFGLMISALCFVLNRV